MKKIVKAIAAGDVDQCKALLDETPRLVSMQHFGRHESSQRGYNVLHLAAFFGQMEVVELLIARGGRVNQRGGREGLTPLHLAVGGGNADVARALISCGGALVDIRDDDEEWLPGDYDAKRGFEIRDIGWTPLYQAVINDDMACARLLVDHSASVLISSATHQKSPLHYAVTHGSLLMLRLLLESGQINVKKEDGINTKIDLSDQQTNGGRVANLTWPTDVWGNTPLHLAAKIGDQDKVDLLVAAGAPRKQRNAEGLTYLDILARASKPTSET